MSLNVQSPAAMLMGMSFCRSGKVGQKSFPNIGSWTEKKAACVPRLLIRPKLSRLSHCLYTVLPRNFFAVRGSWISRVKAPHFCQSGSFTVKLSGAKLSKALVRAANSTKAATGFQHVD